MALVVSELLIDASPWNKDGLALFVILQRYPQGHQHIIINIVATAGC
jgi:hypothetical protein